MTPDFERRLDETEAQANVLMAVLVEIGHELRQSGAIGDALPRRALGNADFLLERISVKRGKSRLELGVLTLKIFDDLREAMLNNPRQ